MEVERNLEELPGTRAPLQLSELTFLLLSHLAAFEIFPLNLKISLGRATVVFIDLPGWAGSLTIALTPGLLFWPGWLETSPVTLTSLGTRETHHLASKLPSDGTYISFLNFIPLL